MQLLHVLHAVMPALAQARPTMFYILLVIEIVMIIIIRMLFWYVDTVLVSGDFVDVVCLPWRNLEASFVNYSKQLKEAEEHVQSIKS